MNNDSGTWSSWTGARRAAKALGLAVTVETAITVGHFVYSADLFDDPARLHVVEPALFSLLVVSALTALFLWRPTKFLAGTLSAIVAVMYIAVFGLVHGGYNHLLKDIVSLAGASDETLDRLFMSPDYARPDHVAFELSGILGLAAAGVVAFWCVRLLSETWPRSQHKEPEMEHVAGLRERSAGGGPLRLVGLALRMLFDAPFKSLGTLVGVVVSVFLMAQQSSLLVGILGRVTSFVRSSGVDIWITSVATESTDATDSLPSSKVGAAASTPGVAWAAPVVQGLGRVTRPDGVREYVKVLGVEAPRYAGLPRSLAPGTTPSLLRASGRIFLNWNDRKTFASAQPGDRVEIDGKASIVAGFFQGMDPHSPYYYVYANIDDARALTDFPLDRITYVAIGVAPGQRIRDVKANLEARIPEVLVKTREELSAMEERYFLVRTPVGVLFGMGTIVAAIIGAAIVAVTLYSTAVDRARDYGTLKAIGARQQTSCSCCSCSRGSSARSATCSAWPASSRSGITCPSSRWSLRRRSSSAFLAPHSPHARSRRSWRSGVCSCSIPPLCSGRNVMANDFRSSIVLEGRGVGRVFGKGELAIRALYPTDLAIRRGEVLVIMGPSGSGKTTLLSILGLVLTPTEGEILLNARCVSRATADEMAVIRRDGVGFIFQQFNLLPSLNALENAAVPLLLAGVPRGDRTSRAMRALDLVGMTDKRGATPRLLSGGQQQRVAIARALVNDAPVLLCDEPTASLDGTTGRGILATLRDLARRGRAVAIVTHDERVLSIADRVVHVIDGRVQEGAGLPGGATAASTNSESLFQLQEVP